MKSYLEYYFDKPQNAVKTYDRNKVTVTSLIKHRNDYVSPLEIGVARPQETQVAFLAAYPFVLNYTDNIQYVFIAENAAAAATRRIAMFEYDINASQYSWKGFITLTPPTATVHTIRGFRMKYYTYKTGRVTASGTTVTGDVGGWRTAGFAEGARIGFGSDDPTQITKWYTISTFNSDTTLTVSAAVTESVANAVYLIEEVRVVFSTTNATTTNGGLFLAKGLHFGAFEPAGTTIPAATTIDNMRAVYWLADAATTLNTLACGVATEEMVSWDNEMVYVINNTTASTLRVFKFNIRKPLTGLAAGRSLSAFEVMTGTQVVSGTIGTLNNGRVATTRHGRGLGIPSLYLVTTTRVYRVELSAVTNGQTTLVADQMVEVPNGGAYTFFPTSTLNSIEYSDVLDKFIINTTVGKAYVTEYETTGAQFDFNFLTDNRQIDHSASSSETPHFPSASAAAFSTWVERGIMHMLRTQTSTSLFLNQMYAVPIGADCEMTTDQYAITPVLDAPSSKTFQKVVVDDVSHLGSKRMGVATEQYDIYYRTSGFDTPQNNWVLVTDGTLGSAGTQIQFKLTWKTIGNTCLPARIRGLMVAYEDGQTVSNFTASVKYTNIATNAVAWRLNAAYGAPFPQVPDLQVRLFDVANNGLLLQDSLYAPTQGTTEYSLDGTSWAAFNAGAANVAGAYVRYKANALPAGVKIKAVLTGN